jgi:hypothetical protein
MMQERAIESSRRQLLDWVLAGCSDTPKTRAKQWIVGARVPVNGSTIRMPHDRISNPGIGLELLNRRTCQLEASLQWSL